MGHCKSFGIMTGRRFFFISSSQSEILYPSTSQGGESYVIYNADDGIGLAIILGMNL